MEAIGHARYDYVSKPFNVEELRQTVARALERPTPFREAVRTEDGAAQVARSKAKAPACSMSTNWSHGSPHDGHGSSGRRIGHGKGTVARAYHTRSPAPAKPSCR